MTAAPQTVATDTAVRLQSVTKVFGTDDAAVHALKGVDLEIGTGQLAVVLGPSGSGKTTLCNIIGGIESATSGSVTVGRREHRRPQARRLGRLPPQSRRASCSSSST